MFKILILLGICIFSLTGCNSNNSSNYNANRLSTTPQETEIAKFSTEIQIKDEDRTKNISLTCAKLNNTIVQPGETFSFCNTLGPASPNEGYEKADIFDSKGNIIKEYGGGKCQVSSTLYNAVLAVPTLSVVERSEHSRKVTYVPEGKDAAVAYGSVDFKFKNNNSYPVKIYASCTDDEVSISIFSIK